jgi:RNA polymerase sigma factor (sigma-70 family)
MTDFTDIYHKHYKSVFRLAHKFLHCKENAADISQEVFVSLHHCMKANKEINNLNAWLYKVTSNQCMTFYKRRKNTLQITENANNVVEEKEQNTGVFEAMKRMKDQDKILLTLYSEDFSYKEIAEITGIKFSSVGKTLARALKKLQNEIETKK